MNGEHHRECHVVTMESIAEMELWYADIPAEWKASVAVHAVAPTYRPALGRQGHAMHIKFRTVVSILMQRTQVVLVPVTDKAQDLNIQPRR